MKTSLLFIPLLTLSVTLSSYSRVSDKPIEKPAQQGVLSDLEIGNGLKDALLKGTAKKFRPAFGGRWLFWKCCGKNTLSARSTKSGENVARIGIEPIVR